MLFAALRLQIHQTFGILRYEVLRAMSIGCDALWTRGRVPTFRRNIPLQSSGPEDHQGLLWIVSA